jgi:hypothetical protein
MSKAYGLLLEFIQMDKRGRNDIFRGSFNCLTFKRQGGEYGNKKI